MVSMCWPRPKVVHAQARAHSAIVNGSARKAIQSSHQNRSRMDFVPPVTARDHTRSKVEMVEMAIMAIHTPTIFGPLSSFNLSSILTSV